MSQQPTRAPSPLPFAVDIKAGKSGSPAPSPRVGSMIIAADEEGGSAFVERMMAQGGPGRTGESEPQMSVTLLPIAYIHILSTAHTHVANDYIKLTLREPQTPVTPFPICPSLASKIQTHAPFLFASQLANYYSAHQGQTSAVTDTPAVEAVVSPEITQSPRARPSHMR